MANMANTDNTPLDEENKEMVGKMREQNKVFTDMFQNIAFTDMLQIELNKLEKGKNVANINQVNMAHIIDFAGEFIGNSCLKC